MSENRSDQSLPTGWHIVRFGDVVRNAKVKVDPETSGLERYVAGGHMETDNLHIRSWGTMGDGYLGPAFHRKFVRGQVLYGSRRTYLRKVAVAEFDGICANTTFVLEPKGNDLLPELLPFIMQTEAFTEHSIKQSKGSTNPYVNWKDLAWYEFPLPALDEQRRIADILWAADDVITGTENALERLGDVQSNVFEVAVTSGLKQMNKARSTANASAWKQVRLGEVLRSAQYGVSKRFSSVHNVGAVPILRIPNIVTGELDLADLRWINLTDEEQERYAINADDVLVVRTNGNPLYVGRSVAIKIVPEGTVFASYLIRLRVDQERILPVYLSALLNSQYLRKTLRYEIRSSAGNYNVNTKGLQRQRIPLPPIQEQERILENMQDLNRAKFHLERHTQASRQLKSRLLNHLLS
jgi:type I restriction enzyme S subunit